MTINEKQSLRKKKAILYLVDNGEYSLGYALLKVEELHDAAKLTDNDYNELADYIEELLNKVEETIENEPPIEIIEESVEETSNVPDEEIEMVEENKEVNDEEINTEA